MHPRWPLAECFRRGPRETEPRNLLAPCDPEIPTSGPKTFDLNPRSRYNGSTFPGIHNRTQADSRHRTTSFGTPATGELARANHLSRRTALFGASRGLDSFDQYLQDVERYPLISDPEEERALARRARTGDKEAAERLVTANLRFVISYVKKYQGRGLGLAELVCIGNEGLLKAVKKFDPDKGVKFISYAVWWIRQTVLQALAEQTRSVRIPLNQNSNLARLARTNTALTQQLGRTPTDQELAREMGEPLDTVRALRRVAAAELSLDAPLDRGDRDSASFGERFAGADGTEIEEDVEATARRHYLETMFDSYLTERERKILYLYYGLDDGEERTLEEIGSLLGVTRERIRQIRNRAFEKLRDSPQGDSLSGFWITN
ncbi:MAG: RNA polymerase sigma factor RpoD/SigA [Gemmatimonadota bacterium]|nr:RNA polymerase sigma factor RpoD/SigA [Gemmatimonadota bacterium]MDE2986229.1 RNA polymerase sigma factor RpoD/SigA [Gemmatimonadota bacterium]